MVKRAALLLSLFILSYPQYAQLNDASLVYPQLKDRMLYFDEQKKPLYALSAEHIGCVYGNCEEGEGIWVRHVVTEERKTGENVTSLRMYLGVYKGLFSQRGRYLDGDFFAMNYTLYVRDNKLVPHTYQHLDEMQTFHNYNGKMYYSRGWYNRSGWAENFYAKRNGRTALLEKVEGKYTDDRLSSVRFNYKPGFVFKQFEGWAVAEDIPLWGRAELSDGGTYIGALLNDKFHGPGRLINRNQIQEGFWENGVLIKKENLPFTNEQLQLFDISREDIKWRKIRLAGEDRNGYAIVNQGNLLFINATSGYKDYGTLFYGKVNDDLPQGDGYYLAYGKRQGTGAASYFDIVEESGKFDDGILAQGNQIKYKTTLKANEQHAYEFVKVAESKINNLVVSNDIQISASAHVPGSNLQERFDHASKLLNNNKHQEAIAAFLKLADEEDESLLNFVYLNLGIAYMALKDFSKASHYVDLGITESPDSEVAYLVKAMLLFAQNKSAQGREFYKTALMLYPDKASLQNSLSFFDEMIKDGFDKQIFSNEKNWAINYINSYNPPLQQFIRDMRSGIQAVNAGNLTLAKSSFDKALNAPALGNEAAYFKGIMNYQAASHFVLRSKWKDALPYLETALASFDKNPHPYNLLFKVRTIEFLATTYGGEMYDEEKGVNLLISYVDDVTQLKREHKHHAAAYLIALAEQSQHTQIPHEEYRAFAELVISFSNEYKHGKHYQARAYNVVGGSYLYSILPPERLKMKQAYEKGIALSKEIKEKELEMTIKGNYAISLYSEGKIDESVKIQEETAQYALTNKQYLTAQARFNNIGGILYFDSQFKRALPYLTKAIEIIESQIKHVSDEEKLNMRNSLASAYQFLSLCYAATGDAKALYNAQNRERAMVLAENISSDNIKAVSTLEDFQKMLTPNEFAVIYSQGPPGELAINLISRNSAKAIYQKNYKPFNEIKTKYLDRINANAESRPGYKPTSGKAVQGTFYENKQENKLDLNDWEQVMEFTRTLLTRPMPARQFILEDLLQAYHELLIKPLLPSLPAGSQLIFYPDGLLNFLPFETLLDAQKKNLVEKFDIRYGQSPEVSLLIASRNHGTRSKALLGMGGAIYEEMAESAEAIRSMDRLVTLQNKALLNARQNKSQREIFAALGFGKMSYLEGTLHEVQTIGKIFGNSADIFLGKEMSENRIKQMSRSGELQNYKIIHLATHGYALPEIPQLSGLAMCIFKNIEGGEDGYLTAIEIAQLNLKADLAVLSACETGLGKIYGGEGVSGLSSSFLMAGANRVLVSLWPVSDAGTMIFMMGMYELVELKGYTYERAVNEMKRRFILKEFGEEFSGPDIWAPFILTGR